MTIKLTIENSLNSAKHCNTLQHALQDTTQHTLQHTFEKKKVSALLILLYTLILIEFSWQNCNALQHTCNISRAA